MHFFFIGYLVHTSEAALKQLGGLRPEQGAPLRRSKATGVRMLLVVFEGESFEEALAQTGLGVRQPAFLYKAPTGTYLCIKLVRA